MALTTTEIRDYNNLNAFSMKRNTAKIVGAQSVKPEISDPQKNLKISTFEESLNFLAGTQSRLDMILQNITSMQEIAEEANGRNVPTHKKEEHFGKLRSLSAGIDQIVEQSLFKKEPFMDGRKVVLVDSSSGNSNKTLDFSNLYTFGQDSLALGEKNASAETGVSYGFATKLHNQSSNLIGLDISSTEASSIATGNLELDTGNYQIEFLYEGADSTIILTDLEGNEKARKEGIDLSGDGQEIVDMGVGFKIFIDKENPFGDTLDKYDYETLGPTSLKADFSYKRNFQHFLRSGEESITETKVELEYNVPVVEGESQLKVSNIASTTVSSGFNQLETGKYLIEVEYHSDNSRVRLLSPDGGLMGLHFIDLEGTDTHSIDLGVGVSIDIQNLNFSQEGATTTVRFDYQKSTQNAEDFSYDSFQNRLEEAANQINALNTLVGDTLKKFQEDEQVRQELLKGNTSSSNNSFIGASSAVSLLSAQANAGTAGLFSSSAPSAVTQVSANELFLSTHSMIQAQTNLKFSSVQVLSKQ